MTRYTNKNTLILQLGKRYSFKILPLFIQYTPKNTQRQGCFLLRKQNRFDFSLEKRTHRRRLRPEKIGNTDKNFVFG